MDSCLVLTSMIRNHLEKPAGSSPRVKKRRPRLRAPHVVHPIGGAPHYPAVRPLQDSHSGHPYGARSIPVSQLLARPTIQRTGCTGLGCTRYAGLAHPITTARVTRIPDRRMQLEVPFPDEVRDPVRNRRAPIRCAVDLDLIQVRTLRTGLCLV